MLAPLILAANTVAQAEAAGSPGSSGILQGFTLTIVGMGVVIAALIVLMLIVRTLGRLVGLLERSAERAQQQAEKAAQEAAKATAAAAEVAQAARERNADAVPTHIDEAVRTPNVPAPIAEPVPAPAPATAPAPVPIVVSTAPGASAIDRNHLVVIAAAVTAALGGARHNVRRIAVLGNTNNSAWSSAGRAGIMTSHRPHLHKRR